MPNKILFFIFSLLISNLSANDLDPYTIFQNHYLAIGGVEKLRAIKTSYTQGQIKVDNLTGTFSEWSETPIRYRLNKDFSVITRQAGDNGKHAWSKDTNGKVLIYKDNKSQQRRQLSILMNDYAHINRNDKNFTLSYKGFINIDDKPTYAIKLSNRINDDIYWYYFDSKSFLLVKTVEKQPDIEIHSHYLDYRLTDGGILMSFNIESEIKPRNKHKSIVIKKFQANPKILDNFFKMPANSLSSITFKQGNSAEDIPFEFNGSLIYFPLLVQNNQTLWIIDSGASLSLIDEDYAKELGLKIYPGIKGFGFGGTFDLSYVKVPSYGPQKVQVKNQTIYAYKGLAQNFDYLQIKGILGYDFLSRFIVKIDYHKQLISFYDDHTFQYKGNGTSIDAPLKYNTFSIPVSLENQFHGYWSIDIGAYDSSLHYAYAKKNGLLQRKGIETTSSGIESAIIERSVEFHSIKLGPYTMEPVMINIPVSKSSGIGSFGELVGNIGNSILRNFTLYLDYQNQKIILETVNN